jgi:hypothetical protein
MGVVVGILNYWLILGVSLCFHNHTFWKRSADFFWVVACGFLVGLPSFLKVLHLFHIPNYSILYDKISLFGWWGIVLYTIIYWAFFIFLMYKIYQKKAVRFNYVFIFFLLFAMSIWGGGVILFWCGD